MKILIGMQICLGTQEKLCPFYCFEYYEVIRNIYKLSQNEKFDQLFIISDMAEGFYHIPDFDHIKKIQVKTKEFLKKTQENALDNEHISKILSKYNDFTIVGYNLYANIYPMILSFLDQKKSVTLYEECVGDVDQNIKNETVGLLQNTKTKIRSLQDLLIKNKYEKV